MSESLSGSSVPRRQLGRLLKQAREQAGIALDAAARDLEWSRARMYRIEAGSTSIRSLDVAQMCAHYGVADDMAEALRSLAKETKAKGWWQAYGDAVPGWFELYVGLEAAADRLRQYEPTMIPGLLQTKDYAARVLGSNPQLSADEAAQAVAVRMERQGILDRTRPVPPSLEVIVDGRALLGERGTGQLPHLVDMQSRRKVSIRVIPPTTQVVYASLAGGFVILDFPRLGTRPAEPSTVYSESLTGALYLDKPEEVGAYAEAWQTFSRQALSVEESTAFIKDLESSSGE
ncbi:helix-turn-helix domain-containing protein [Micromonospora sp. NPDC050417]|uniref:helix-turn-helix domain-containing protein n=1 Tax=Micromonospora sp. NPDC050417 TaxID=3364280 RepID=UPI0037A53037